MHTHIVTNSYIDLHFERTDKNFQVEDKEVILLASRDYEILTKIASQQEYFIGKKLMQLEIYKYLCKYIFKY